MRQIGVLDLTQDSGKVHLPCGIDGMSGLDWVVCKVSIIEMQSIVFLTLNTSAVEFENRNGAFDFCIGWARSSGEVGIKSQSLLPLVKYLGYHL